MRKYILITLATLTLASCLDEDPRDRLTEEDVFATSTDLYLNAVANLYNYIGGHEDGQGLQGTTRGIYDLNTFTSDEAILPTRGGDWYDGGLWLSLYMHTFDAGTAPIENSWNYLYKVIVLCNHSLDYLQKYSHLIPTDQQAPLQAEVRGIRALCYFYLLDLFGRVPWVNSSSISMNETDQLSRHRLFWKLYDEVNEILPHLPLVRSNMQGNYYGRITAPVMWFILAKMTLNAEIWTDDIWTDDQHLEGDNILFTIAGEQMTAWEACIYYCGLLTNFGYKLEPTYSTNFNTRNESSLENIFTIPMDKTLYTNQFKYLFRSRHNNHGAALGMASENGTCATVSAVRTYGYTVTTSTSSPTPCMWTRLACGSTMASHWCTSPLPCSPTSQARPTRRPPVHECSNTRPTAPPTTTDCCRATTSCSSGMPTCCSWSRRPRYGQDRMVTRN